MFPSGPESVVRLAIGGSLLNVMPQYPQKRDEDECHESALDGALRSREQIGQAIGIVMQRYGLTHDPALAFMVRTSQTKNIKMRDLAAEIIAETLSPDPPTTTSHPRRRHERPRAR
jgi:hypothetical protein